MPLVMWNNVNCPNVKGAAMLMIKIVQANLSAMSVSIEETRLCQDVLGTTLMA